jgi:23S rRNA (guanine2445-N2)-methyltransferase / 23S rRNA (guanine2069-N7)-methyltransferase
MSSSTSLRFFATTAKEMESLLEQEIRALGARQTEIKRAGVAFEGDIETAYRVCLESRVANRVLLPLKTFAAPTPEKLYGGVKSIRWTDHLTARQTIAVDFSSSQSLITHTHFGALKTKDAICDQLRSVTGERPSVDPLRADIRINVYLFKDEATVSLDLSGQSMHRRGYREEGVEAPLKENLAAAALMQAGWLDALRSARAQGTALPAFVDPMCGSGTLPIEAAFMAIDRAPGLDREHWGFVAWKKHDAALWDRLVSQARAREISDRKLLPRIVGYDRDSRAVRIALANLERAGLAGKVHVEKRELGALEAIEPRGILVVNPPYGERLGEEQELKPLYKQMGDLFKQRMSGWDCFILTSSPELAKSVGLRPSRRIPLFNGALECRLLKFEMYAGTHKTVSRSSNTAVEVSG